MSTALVTSPLPHFLTPQPLTLSFLYSPPLLYPPPPLANSVTTLSTRVSDYCLPFAASAVASPTRIDVAVTVRIGLPQSSGSVT